MDFISLGFAVATYFAIDNLSSCIISRGVSEVKPTEQLKETEIILGGKQGYSNRAVTLDLKQFPSLSISGITNCGKTKMIEYILKNTKMSKVLLNAYSDDITSVYCKRIVEIEEIEKYLDYLLLVKSFNKPLLVVIDETLSLLSYKAISKKLHLLLTKNRHKNLFIICLFQELNKYNCPFKSLFASRVAMRAIQTSDIISSLGTSLEEYPRLQNREFILLSDNIYFGKTFDI